MASSKIESGCTLNYLKNTQFWPLVEFTCVYFGKKEQFDFVISRLVSRQLTVIKICIEVIRLQCKVYIKNWGDFFSFWLLVPPDWLTIGGFIKSQRELGSLQLRGTHKKRG